MLRAAVCVFLLLLWPGWTSGQDDRQGPCHADGSGAFLRALPEASGIASSRRTPGLFWTHNDSGDALLFALDAQGALKARVRIPGAVMEDWEDIAVGPCPRGSCIYAADIGDNNASRRRITIYRMPEPAAGDEATPAPEVFHAAYPDGPHDAETLIVTGEGQVLIVTKGNTGPVGVYRFPTALNAGITATLERVGRPTMAVGDRDRRVTGGSASGDGRWIALRTHDQLLLYPATDFVNGRWMNPTRVDLRGLREPQGEGVALAGDAVYLVGEGGSRSQAGTFTRLRCAWNP